ncbi:MAG: type II toxin-antitoxin system RelE/ParE family toxin [Chloroflexi bacterium]|nr:type II toxin-antitoxin system RelE/ParE family toxin [Chloroflexota bacterium]
MSWEVETTPEFSEWFGGLDKSARLDVAAKLALLRDVGPTLGRPHADTVSGSAYPNMKELRIKHDQIRVFFAFDPRRIAILLVGGAKVGDDRFYDRMIPKADGLYGRHLAAI